MRQQVIHYNTNKFLTLIILGLSIATCASAQTADEQLAQYQVLTISAMDDLAVVKTPNGKMVTMKAGSELPDLNITVTQVLHNKLVLRETSGTADTIWLYKTTHDNTSRVQRISSVAPKELLEQPISIVQ